jgi:hypothetical protein
MQKANRKVFCPYAFSRTVVRRVKEFFTAPANYQVMLILWLSVSAGIIFVALDILEFPFISYDRFSDWICLGGTRHTVGVLSALVCIPLVAAKRRLGYYGAFISGLVIFLLCAVHVVYMPIAQTYRFEEQIHGPILWALVQIPVILYGHQLIRTASPTS